jgi:hypothetical protein
LKKIDKEAKRKKQAELEKEAVLKEKNRIKRAFVTFRVIRLKNMFVKALQASSCQRWRLKSKK